MTRQSKEVVPKKKVLKKSVRKNGATTFSSFDIVRMYDLKQETFRDWIGWGFIDPHVKAQGKGTKSLFTVRNLYEVALFKFLLKDGVLRERAGEWIKLFREILIISDEVGKKPKFLVLKKKGDSWSAYRDGFIEYGEDQPLPLSEEIDQYHVINVDKIMAEVDRMIAV